MGNTPYLVAVDSLDDRAWSPGNRRRFENERFCGPRGEGGDRYHPAPLPREGGSGRRRVRRPHGAYADAVADALSDRDPWHGFIGYIEAACAMQAADYGFADVLTMTFPTAKALEQRRTEAHAAMVLLINRAKATGRLRQDFDPSDLVLIHMANLGVVNATGDAAPDVWRRVVALSDPIPPGPSPGPPARLARTRSPLQGHAPRQPGGHHATRAGQEPADHLIPLGGTGRATTRRRGGLVKVPGSGGHDPDVPAHTAPSVGLPPQKANLARRGPSASLINTSFARLPPGRTGLAWCEAFLARCCHCYAGVRLAPSSGSAT